MTKQNDKNQGEKQLDLFKYVVQLWDDRRIVIWTMAACVVIGLLSYIMRPTKYSTRATLLPSYASSESSLGNLGALASLAGVNVGGGTGGISPDLYPTVSQSVPYLLELINVPLDSEDSDRAMTLLDIAKACAEAGTTERYYKFASTSKVTLPGAGIAAMAASPQALSAQASRLVRRGAALGPRARRSQVPRTDRIRDQCDD